VNEDDTMTHAPTDESQMLYGCTGRCQQGRIRCDCLDELANGTTRATQPGELLPNTPDPAEGRNGGWYAAGLVVLAAFAGVALAQVWRP
jgi:hypothetical protein